ncbi:MAG TPA: sensor histidine kinase [Solirubrobacterales bacterium]|nr:sensor histidine kinase [Solirubrobacterales bacterium]
MSQPELRHTAFVYSSDAEYVEAAADFLRAGLEGGEGALVAAPRDRQALIRRALGSVSEEVGFLDLAAVADRPARTLAAQYAALYERLRRFPAVRLLVGVEPGPAQDGWLDWLGYEASLERALAAMPVWALCGYDARRTPAPMLDAVLRGHPALSGGARLGSPRADLTEILRERTPLPRALPDLRTVAAGEGPEALREQLGAALAAQGVGGSRALETVLAANEAILNAFGHGEPPVEVRLGRVGNLVVCEVVDQGPGFDDPLIGFDPPGEPGGQAPGMWVVRQLVKKLEAFPSDARFTVRLWL